MNEELKKAAAGHARTFSGITPPNKASYIGALKKNGDTYYYWKDAEGNYWVDTESQRRFAIEMAEAERRIKKRRQRPA